MSLKDEKIKNFPKTKLSRILTDIITTPCEKVLRILNEIKNFLSNIENSKKYIYELNWVIKVISSRSLYSIQVNQKESLENFQNEYPEMKQFLDLINLYNGQINETKKYNNYINKTMLFIENNENKNENDNGVIRELGLQTPSSKLKRKNFFKFLKGKTIKKENDVKNETNKEENNDEDKSDEEYEKKLNIFSSSRSRSFKLSNGKMLINQIKNTRITNSKKHSTTIQKTPIEFSKENLQLIKEIIDNHNLNDMNDDSNDIEKSSNSEDSLNLSSDSLHFESKESNNSNNNNNNTNNNSNNNNTGQTQLNNNNNK